MIKEPTVSEMEGELPFTIKSFPQNTLSDVSRDDLVRWLYYTYKAHTVKDKYKPWDWLQLVKDKIIERE